MLLVDRRPRTDNAERVTRRAREDIGAVRANRWHDASINGSRASKFRSQCELRVRRDGASWRLGPSIRARAIAHSPRSFLWSFTPHSGSDQSISHHNVYVPGTRAAQAMSTVAQEMVNLSHSESRHGRTSARSIAIATRLATDNFRQYGHRLAYTPEEGHAYRLIFGLVLEEIESRGFHDRMGPVPRAATDVVKFHGSQAVGFHSRCQPAWKDMTDAQRLQSLKFFLCNKFRISCEPGVIVPPPAKIYRRSDISWNSFWMTRKEIDEIAEAAFEVYLRDAPFLGFR